MAKAKNEIISLQSLEVNKFSEIQGLKEEQTLAVKNFPFVKIEDSKTYETAKKNRTGLLSQSTKIERIGKDAVKLLNLFKGKFSGEFEELSAITREPYDKQQEEVKRYEQILADQAAERQRLKEEADKKIIAEIDELCASFKPVIEKMTFAEMETVETNIEGMKRERMGTFGEFDVLFESKITELLERYDARVIEIEEEQKTKEKERKQAHEDYLSGVEKKVSEAILDMDLETALNYEATLLSLFSAGRNNEEYEERFKEIEKTAFERYAQRLKDLMALKQADDDKKELENLRAEKLRNDRSKVLIEKGYSEKENGDFEKGVFVVISEDLVSKTDEVFNEMLDSFEALQYATTTEETTAEISEETTSDRGLTGGAPVSRRYAQVPVAEEEKPEFVQAYNEVGSPKTVQELRNILEKYPDYTLVGEEKSITVFETILENGTVIVYFV